MKRTTMLQGAAGMLPALGADDGKETQALLAEPAKENVLQELSGSPEGEKWAPNVEVFKDVPHVARSSQQLTLMALGTASLAQVIERAQKNQSGTVFSVTPVMRHHKAMAEVLVGDKGKVRRTFQPL